MIATIFWGAQGIRFVYYKTRGKTIILSHLKEIIIGKTHGKLPLNPRQCVPVSAMTSYVFEQNKHPLYIYFQTTKKTSMENVLMMKCYYKSTNILKTNTKFLQIQKCGQKYVVSIIFKEIILKKKYNNKKMSSSSTPFREFKNSPCKNCFWIYF